MKEFKGTPGKWEITENPHYLELHPIGNIQSFASIHVNEYLGMNKDISKANAKLIAAAPELLELAFKFRADLINMLHQSPARDNRISQIDEVINKALS